MADIEDIKKLISKLSEQLSETDYTIAVDVAPETAAKLEWLREGGRDFLARTPQMAQAAMTAARQTLARQTGGSTPRFDMNAIVQAIGEGVWSHVLRRFKDTRDVMMKALARRTIEAKRRKGRPTVIGIDTGAMFRDMANATVSVQKKR